MTHINGPRMSTVAFKAGVKDDKTKSAWESAQEHSGLMEQEHPIRIIEDKMDEVEEYCTTVCAYQLSPRPSYHFSTLN